MYKCTYKHTFIRKQKCKRTFIRTFVCSYKCTYKHSLPFILAHYCLCQSVFFFLNVENVVLTRLVLVLVLDLETKRESDWRTGSIVSRRLVRKPAHKAAIHPITKWLLRSFLK